MESPERVILDLPRCSLIQVQPMSFFLAALGLMMVFEGIPYFCFPTTVKSFARRIPEVPDNTLRMIGFALMLIGLITVYFGRSFAENG